MYGSSISCRDGLPDPRVSKKRITNTTADKSEVKPTKVNESLPVTTKLKKAVAQPDKALQQLETLHASTTVKTGIGIRDGHHLKLDNPPSSSGGHPRRRPKALPPNFNLTFADFNDNSSAGMYNLDVDDDDDDDEDLPDIHELLHPTQTSTAKQKRTPSSASNYSNSEIDALIRDIPLDNAETQDDGTTLPSLDGNLQASPRYLFNARYRPSTPLSSLKRAREPENESPAERVKRFKDSRIINLSKSKPVHKERKV